MGMVIKFILLLVCSRIDEKYLLVFKQKIMQNEDSPKCQMQRRKLVEGIRSKGIREERVLSAIGRVPRHLFMPENLRTKAYMDNAFPIGNGQTISQPYTVAYQTRLLKIEPGMKVLEVGTGSAYQAAVLAQMGAEVYTIERAAKILRPLPAFQLPATLYQSAFPVWRWIPWLA